MIQMGMKKNDPGVALLHQVPVQIYDYSKGKTTTGSSRTKNGIKMQPNSVEHKQIQNRVQGHNHIADPQVAGGQQPHITIHCIHHCQWKI